MCLASSYLLYRTFPQIWQVALVNLRWTCFLWNLRAFWCLKYLPQVSHLQLLTKLCIFPKCLFRPPTVLNLILQTLHSGTPKALEYSTLACELQNDRSWLYTCLKLSLISIWSNSWKHWYWWLVSISLLSYTKYE